MKKIWPSIKATLKNGKAMVVVDARIGGRGQRRYFATMKTAKAWADVQRIRRESEGHGAFDDRELAAYGWNTQDAIRFALQHLRRQAVSVPIEEAIRQLLESKKAAGRAESYLSLLELNLRKLSEHFKGRLISTITATDIERFLAGLNVRPHTWNTIRQHAITLWRFATKAKFAQENVAKDTERAKGIGEAPGILKPEQAAALLAESDNDLLAFHAIGLFAGLRVSEVKALDWRDVDLAGGFIHVGAKISKTRSRRLVPILDNLRAWLQPIARPSGPVVGLNLRKRHVVAREHAGIKEWPENCMRHSFVSYRLAATGNAAQVALESGHDQAILFRHYRELVKPYEAARYWQIVPAASDASEKILSLSILATP
jgi:integrase